MFFIYFCSLGRKVGHGRDMLENQRISKMRFIQSELPAQILNVITAGTFRLIVPLSFIYFDFMSFFFTCLAHLPNISTTLIQLNSNLFLNTSLEHLDSVTSDVCCGPYQDVINIK